MASTHNHVDSPCSPRILSKFRIVYTPVNVLTMSCHGVKDSSPAVSSHTVQRAFEYALNALLARLNQNSLGPLGSPFNILQNQKMITRITCEL